MKQYTTPEQTAKLIELGFETPKSIEKVTYIEQYGCGYETAYSIGELIEKLPPRYNHKDIEIERDWRFERWLVFYRGGGAAASATELIDALYDMCVKLKERGVI